MHRLIVYVAPDLETSAQVVEAWRKAGVPSFTIIESSGLRAHQEIMSRDDLPLMPGLRHVLEKTSRSHRTMLAVVQKDLVDEVQAATESAAGDLTQPNTGLFIVLPIETVLGTPGLLTPDR